MKIVRIAAIIGIVLFLFSCRNQGIGLTVINSQSFPEQNIIIAQPVNRHLLPDSLVSTPVENPTSAKLGKLISLAEKLQKNQSDSLWNSFSAGWYDFAKDGLAMLAADSTKFADAGMWAELNIELLKLSGEVRFGDAIEDLLYKYESPVLSRKQLKSIIYTHIDDQIFINVIAPSSFNYQHTTGGEVRLIQNTDYPLSNEMTLTCETADVRYMDVYIRIPSWAVNPTVTHGNVKYVAHPGEYCEVYRKWNNGDEINVRLKN